MLNKVHPAILNIYPKGETVKKNVRKETKNSNKACRLPVILEVQPERFLLK